MLLDIAGMAANDSYWVRKSHVIKETSEFNNGQGNDEIESNDDSV